MSYHSELHYLRTNTDPREMWDGFSETEDGFEPVTDLIAEDLDQDFRVEMERGFDERDWLIAELLRAEVRDAARSASCGLDELPF